jgi:UDP-N-acetyl-D-galactosamine dehydrogenase
MGEYIASSIADRLPNNARVLVLGLTFKENVPDLRNSKVIDVIIGLKSRGLAVDVHDVLADAAEARKEYDITLMDSLGGATGYDAVVGAVSHDAYSGFGCSDFARLVKPGGLIADVKGMWRKTALPADLERWSL